MKSEHEIIAVITNRLDDASVKRIRKKLLSIRAYGPPLRFLLLRRETRTAVAKVKHRSRYDSGGGLADGFRARLEELVSGELRKKRAIER